MAGRTEGILAVIVVSRVFILAVCLGYVSIQALAATGAFQQAGQYMRMFDVMHLLTLKVVSFTLFLCQLPVCLRYDGLMMSVIYRILILLHDMHFITGSDLLLGASPAVCDLTHIHRIIKHALHEAG